MLSLTPLPLSQAELPDWLLAVAMGEISSLNHFLPKKKKNLLLVFDILFEKANFTSLLRNRLLFDIMITHRTTWNHLWKSGTWLALRREGGRDAKEQELLCTKLQSAIWCFCLPGWLLCKAYNLASSQLYPFATCMHAALVTDI